MSVGSVAVAQSANQRAGGGAIPTSALQSLRVIPVNIKIVGELIKANHYTHSLSGGTKLAFGVFLNGRLLGALTLGAGSFNSYKLVAGAVASDCLTLTRLWLSDSLPKNSESRVLGIVMRSLKNNTTIKFLVTYADPAQGHLGVIYQATAWHYTGLSQATPKYDLGDGKERHSRSLGAAFGSRSVHYFEANSVPIKAVPQSPKHRYVYFLDPAWQHRLHCSVLPYPKAHQNQKEG